MNDESGRDPGTQPSPSGDGDHGNSPTDETAGHSTPGDGSGANGGHRGGRSSERVRWAGVAAGFVTLVVLIAQMYGAVSGNTDKSNQIIDKVQQVPGVLDQIQDTIEDQPTPMNTTIIQKGQAGKPGQPGQPGKPGEVVTSPPKTIVIEKPGATKTVTPAPQPTCGTSLLGTCVAR